MGGINLYRHVANNPLNAIDPFGLDEHTLTIQSYISQPSVFGFQSDNHGSTVTPSNAYRTTSTITFDDSKPGYTVTSDTGTTTFLPTGTTDKASSANLTGSETFSGDGIVSVNMDGSASNPIVPGAPPIAYDLNVTIDFNTGDLFGSMTLTDFPSFQIFLDGDNIYNHLAKNTLLAPFGLRDQIFDLIKKKIKKKPGCP